MNYIIISEESFEKARKEIKENIGKKIIFLGKNDELNRKIIEKEKIDILLISLSGKKDRMKQKDSGLNHIIAEIAKKKGVSIGVDFDEIMESKEKKEILSRIKQNIRIAIKKRVKIIFIAKKHKRTKEEFRSLGLVLGMPTWMAKNNYLNIF